MNLRFGDYPREYDRAKHGTYDPARFYGKPDTPFGEVKIGELTSWVGRRNMGFRPLAGLCSRAFWRWQHKYVLPRYAGIAYFFQVGVGMSIFFYILNYPRISGHAHRKYH